MNNPQIKIVNLRILDNTLNATKARIIYDIVENNHLLGFTL
jgi:hypothetical protein